MRSRLVWFSLCACLMLARGAVAGQDCGERAAPSAVALAQGLALGQRVTQQLEASRASMALVARIGLNLSEFGQRYTHMAVAVRDHVRDQWVAIHLFNPCGKGESEILNQPLEKFFEVELHEFDALVALPDPALQARLRRVFMSPFTGRLLHHKPYNLIAHPFNTAFQNSNQWILETMTLALDERGLLRSRLAAQAWLREQGFEPAGIRIPALRRTGARLFSPHVHFSDHTQEEFERSTYAVVTVDSILRFLGRLDPGLTQQAVR